MAKPTPKPKKKVAKLEQLKQVNLNAAGLDIGDDEIYAAVPEGRDAVSVKVFQTFIVDLNALADWLEACGVDTVAMESTGVYWIPIFEILEARGFEVYLVNARHIKNVTGRKSDWLDCQWIQQLHTYGLLQASFRPAQEVCPLRALARHRANLIRATTTQIQHMQKALQQMNLKLTNVVSDITGVTGLAIIRDIVAGVHDPVELARHRNPHCASSAEDIAKALEGNYKDEHLFVLQQALENHDFFQQQIAACDVQIEQCYSAFTPRVDVVEKPLPPSKRPQRKPRDNEPHFDLRLDLYRMAGVDLTQIDGLNVQAILSEIGVDMRRWPTVKHFTSWLGVSPQTEKTGGKVIKTSTRQTQNRAAAALRMAAQSLTHSKSALGVQYRQLRARLGKPEAITAMAHKLARTIYAMLKNKTAYRDLGEEAYTEQVRARAIRNLKRKAAQLGFDLAPHAA